MAAKIDILVVSFDVGGMAGVRTGIEAPDAGLGVIGQRCPGRDPSVLETMEPYGWIGTRGCKAQ